MITASRHGKKKLFAGRHAQCFDLGYNDISTPQLRVSNTPALRATAGATREQDGTVLELHENRKAQCWSYMRTGWHSAGAT